jgi:thiamine biosynthesis lipoprotein
MADAWATACMVAGTEAAKALIERNNFLEGYLIFSDEKGEMRSWMSEGLKNLIEEL